MKTLRKTLEDRRLNAAAGALILWVALGPWVWGYASSPAAGATRLPSRRLAHPRSVPCPF
jgi:hypothetical protein